MRQSAFGKIATVLLPPLIIVLVAIFVTDIKTVCVLLALSAIVAVSITAAIIVRSNLRLQAKQELLLTTLNEHRSKQSKKEFDILDELSRQRSMIAKIEKSLNEDIERADARLGAVSDRLDEILDSISTAYDATIRDTSPDYVEGDAIKRNRSAVQDLFTRMLNGQNQISERLYNIESREIRRASRNDGGHLD